MEYHISSRTRSSTCRSKMAGNDPMHYTYSNRSVDSPDVDYDDPDQQSFELFDSFLTFDDWLNENKAAVVPEYPNHTPVNVSAATEDGSRSIGSSSSHLQGSSSRGTGTGQARTKEKVAFKTKSQVEILDDGFKWRKYGKKMVKNSPNPRNYFRCSAEGCSVKKRVERDVEDARYVITTYEGVHNHERPSNF